MASKKFTYKEFEQWCSEIESSTPVNAAEPVGDKQARLKLLREDYVAFFEYYFPKFAKAKCAWYHKFAADLIKANPVINLIEEIYRGGAKSVHISMGVPIWLMVRGELKTMILVSKTEKMADRLLASIQAQLMKNQRLVADYGEQYMQGSWEDGEFITRQGCAFFSCGLGQSPRGTRAEENRPDTIVFDDCDSKKLSKNPELVREAFDWAMEELRPTMDIGYQRFLVANNRFSKCSILNTFIEEKLKGAKKVNLKKEIKNLPAPGACSYQHLRSWHHLRIDAVDVNFNPSWPEKYTRQYWQDKKDDTTTRAWMREYMNTPVTEGTVFKNEWIKWGKVLPLEEYDYSCLYNDPSWKATSTSDHKASVWLCKKGKELHIVKVRLRQWSITSMVKFNYDVFEASDFGRRDKPFTVAQKGPALVDYWIEANANQDEHLADYITEGEARGYQLPIRPDFRAKPGKEDRIESLSPFFERGFVLFNEEETEDPDMQRFIEHLLLFARGGSAPDDGPDAMEGGNYYAQRITRTMDYTPRTGKRQHRNAH